MSRFSSMLVRHWLGILGLVVIFFYLTTAFQIIDYPDMMFTVLFLAISPVAIIDAITKVGAQVKYISVEFTVDEVIGHDQVARFPCTVCPIIAKSTIPEVVCSSPCQGKAIIATVGNHIVDPCNIIPTGQKAYTTHVLNYSVGKQ